MHRLVRALRLTSCARLASLFRSTSAIGCAGAARREFIVNRASISSMAPLRSQANAAATAPGGAVVRTNIGIFGAMNVGKSMLVNALTQQETSIVDSTPGTTADPKVALMEIHRIGPSKIFDTPGIDEKGELGSKKKEKAFNCLKESDVALVVVDPFEKHSVHSAKEVLDYVRKLQKADPDHKKTVIVVYNIFARKMAQYATKRDAFNDLLESIEKQLGLKDDARCISLDLSQPDGGKRLARFIEENVNPHAHTTNLLPPIPALENPRSVVFLNIPMDGETPSGRLLRPQAMSQELLLRNFVSTFAYRMDLGKGRSKNPAESAQEEQRFREAVKMLNVSGHMPLLITDSQAMDLVHKWTLDPVTKKELVPITTFSIMMINYLSGGRLTKFLEGIKVFDQLQPGDRVLICEACNHNRVQDDIGTVQIPRKIDTRWKGGVQYDHAFGREYQTKELKKYKLLIHCGGCMLDVQKMSARLSDLEESGIPITNYGLILSHFQSKQALQRVIRPWGITL